MNASPILFGDGRNVRVSRRKFVFQLVSYLAFFPRKKMTDSTKKRHFFEEEEEEDGDVPMKSPIKTPKRVPIVQPACDDDVSMSRSPSPERPEQEPMSDLAAKTEEPPPRNNTAVHFFETTRDVEMTEPQQQQQTSSTTTTVMTSSSTQESTPSSLSLSDKVDLLRAIVGEQVSESQLVQLLNSCKGDMELAVNAYFATTADASPSLARPSSRSKWRPDRKYFGEIIVEGKPKSLVRAYRNDFHVRNLFQVGQRPRAQVPCATASKSCLSAQSTLLLLLLHTRNAQSTANSRQRTSWFGSGQPTDERSAGYRAKTAATFPNSWTTISARSMRRSCTSHRSCRRAWISC